MRIKIKKDREEEEHNERKEKVLTQQGRTAKETDIPERLSANSTIGRF